MDNTFSFLNTQATLAGPGGIISLGAGAAVDEEGITVAFIEDANQMRIGADGSPMHTLNASKAAKVSVRLLKTSPINKKLMDMFNFQRTSSALWGKNMLKISDSARGDIYAGQQCAFVKVPDNTYAKQSGMLDWEFHVGIMDGALGDA